MKCSQCGAELNGNKFCTNCGAPAPQETTGAVCSNCGEPVEGKFCTKCGTPVAASSDAENNAAQNVAEAPAETAGAAPQPVDFQNPYVEDTQPVQYNADTTQNAGQPTNNGYTGQQFTNQPNGTYAGQQFTNKPNTAPNGKKPMSGGKIAIIVVSIVVGLIIILGIIGGVVACNIAKTAINKYGDSVSGAVDDLSSYIDNYLDDSSSDLDSYLDDNSSDLADAYDSSTYTDPETGVVFQESTRYDGWAVVDYEKSDYNASTITVDIPEQFQGRDVVEISRLYVYDNDSTDKGYIKIIIPGTVKVIDSYSISFLEDINEVVIEDGVEIIEEDAFAGDKDLLKVHIPASVTEIDDDCGIGYYTDTEHDYEEIPFGKEFTLYCEKGSAAESYAKEHKLNYEIEK